MGNVSQNAFLFYQKLLYFLPLVLRMIANVPSFLNVFLLLNEAVKQQVAYCFVFDSRDQNRGTKRPKSQIILSERL